MGEISLPTSGSFLGGGQHYRSSITCQIAGFRYANGYYYCQLELSFSSFEKVEKVPS